MSIERYTTNKRLSQATVYNGVVYTAGQVSLNATGGTIEAQTKDVLALLDGVLAQGGSDKSRILSATIWLADMKDFQGFNTVWEAWMPEGCAPARACVESKLVQPGFIVEVAAIAAVKE